MKKRIIALVLAVCMLFTCVQFAAFAGAKTGNLEFRWSEGDSYSGNVITYVGGYELTVSCGKDFEMGGNGNPEIQNIAEGTEITFSLVLPEGVKEYPDLMLGGAREKFADGVFVYRPTFENNNVIAVELDLGRNNNQNKILEIILNSEDTVVGNSIVYESGYTMRVIGMGDLQMNGNHNVEFRDIPQGTKLRFEIDLPEGVEEYPDLMVDGARIEFEDGVIETEIFFEDKELNKNIWLEFGDEPWGNPEEGNGDSDITITLRAYGPLIEQEEYFDEDLGEVIQRDKFDENGDPVYLTDEKGDIVYGYYMDDMVAVNLNDVDYHFFEENRDYENDRCVLVAHNGGFSDGKTENKLFLYPDTALSVGWEHLWINGEEVDVDEGDFNVSASFASTEDTFDIVVEYGESNNLSLMWFYDDDPGMPTVQNGIVELIGVKRDGEDILDDVFYFHDDNGGEAMLHRGDIVTLAILPNHGYYFDELVMPSADQVKQEGMTFTFVMDSNQMVDARFVPAGRGDVFDASKAADVLSLNIEEDLGQFVGVMDAEVSDIAVPKDFPTTYGKPAAAFNLHADFTVAKDTSINIDGYCDSYNVTMMIDPAKYTGENYSMILIEDDKYHEVQADYDAATGALRFPVDHIGDMVLVERGNETYDVSVGGVAVTAASRADVLGDGTVRFDPVTNTLTLDSAVVPTVSSTLEQLTVEAIGLPSIETKDTAIICTGDVFIFGDGLLQIKTDNVDAAAISCRNLALANTMVSINTPGVGVRAETLDLQNEGAMLVASEEKGNAIELTSKELALTISDSALIIGATDGCGVYTEGDIEVGKGGAILSASDNGAAARMNNFTVEGGIVSVLRNVETETISDMGYIATGSITLVDAMTEIYSDTKALWAEGEESEIYIDGGALSLTTQSGPAIYANYNLDFANTHRVRPADFALDEECTTFVDDKGNPLSDLMMCAHFDEDEDLVCDVCQSELCAHEHVAWYTLEGATYTKTGIKLCICNDCGAVVEQITTPKLQNTANVFTDVSKKDWYYKNGAIDYAYNAGLFGGTTPTTFAPNTNMTRGMFVTVLGRLAGVDGKGAVTKFKDVKKSAYYSGYVKWASESGIVGGTSATTFEPDANVTREQICKMMVEYCNAMNITLYEINEPIQFKDASKISKWAREYVSICQRAALVNGKDGGKFDPQGNATRAEVATILKNFDAYYLTVLQVDYDNRY